jgi:phosphoribosylaminoimidazolecarboxamide formyltransferase/IMP cyclohydrolase
VKTLHPAIHAGLLADQRDEDHLRQIAGQGIEPFDLLVSNLYPFRETVASGAGFDDTIEKIDIGGPAMVRASAKNFESVTVVVNPGRYDAIVEEIDLEGGITRATRFALAAEAFAHTAAYDAAVAVGSRSRKPIPTRSPGSWVSRTRRSATCGTARTRISAARCSPTQGCRCVRRRRGPPGQGDVVQQLARRVGGRRPGPRAARRRVRDREAQQPVRCGRARRPRLVLPGAFACDEVSAFGGIVAFRGACDEAAADAMREIFTEVVIAPSFTEGAMAVFAERPNLRVVRAPLDQPGGWDVRTLPGGALIQDFDVVRETRADWKVVSSREPTAQEWRDLELAWTIAWRVKSNTIVFVKDGATVGIGAGQMSRVDSSWIAARKAGERAHGAVCASDAFFPFPDALEVAADAGCGAVIHPGGSKGDEAVLAAAEGRGMAVVLTGTRHFRH